MVADPKPRRRWFRFSLRSLLVFTVLMGSLSWIAKERMQSHRELEIAKELRASSTDLTVRGLFDALFEPPDRQSRWRTLLSAILGVRIRQVASVRQNFDVTPLAELTSLEELILADTRGTDLRPLARVKTLKVLHLAGTKVTDLSPVASLTNLRKLDLGSTKVSDLTPLSALDSLEVLNLHGTQVTELSPLAGLTNLEWLNLIGTPVRDITPLSGFKSLKKLYLSGTAVSEEQVKALQQALPKCEIRR